MAKKRGSKNLIANGFLSQIKWGESYTSLFLGAVVVVVVLVLVFSFIKSRNVQTGETGSTSNEQDANKLPETYTVKQGDDLWTVAEKLYGSGYNWVDLAKENKLQNPGLLYVGVKLSIPNVTSKTPTVQSNTLQQTNPITGTSYTVTEGDYLWAIALRAYGDGYKWVTIAKANNLKNPDIIHPGNVLKLPR